MPEISRRTFLEVAGLASAGLISGCGGVTNINGSDTFSVPVFSDVHFQPFINPLAPNGTSLNTATVAANIALVAQLDAVDTTEWPAIFQGSANAPNFTPSAPGTDTNYALLGLAFASIKQNLGTSPAVLFTGDFLGHGVAQLYPVYSVNKTSAEAVAFADKTLTFVLQQIRAAVGSIPVYFALGNCDSYTGYGPDSMFLANNAQQLYALGLNSTGNEQDVIGSITNGGYYSIEPVDENLMIIGLNTIQFSPLVQNSDGSESDAAAVDAQLAWFDSQLAAAQTAGKKVWLLMHVPPGADEGTTAKSVNAAGHLASATMMWEPNYQATFLDTVAKYPGVIALTLAGHTHMDEYRIMSAGNVVEIIPGISPCFGNDPAYRVFAMDNVSLAPADYSAFNCNLAATQVQFNNYYQCSEAYPVQGTLGSSLELLCPQLVTSSALQTLYRGYYYSGNNAVNPITNTNWPVYWAGIDNMLAQDLTNAVNSYS